MVINPQTTSNDPPTSLPTLAAAQRRSDWVDVQLSHIFMAHASTSSISTLVALAVTVFVLYGSVSTAWLFTWTLAVVCIAVYRHWLIASYRNQYKDAGAARVACFFEHYRWSWPFSALVWTGLLFLYLGQVPLTLQFICILIIVGMGVFSVTLLSARLDCFLPYVHTLSVTSLCAVAASWFEEGEWSVEQSDAAFVVLIVMFWVVIVKAGRGFHMVQRRGYELQYDNEHLITSLRDQTDTAMRAVTVKNNLLANAAHDLRQPVHALAFYADWLRSEPELAAEVVPKILIATDSVNALFNSLFDFAKIEAGAVQAQFSAVPVSHIMEDLKVQFSPSAFEKHITLRQHLAPGYVWTDPVLIRRILGNLVANAIRYTDSGGVLLAARLRPGCVWFEVWDTGVGIAPEHQALVFTEFYKASVHKGTEEGFGLGLAIVQRLSDVLGHKVTMKTQPGRGTCMRVEIPLASAH